MMWPNVKNNMLYDGWDPSEGLTRSSSLGLEALRYFYNLCANYTCILLAKQTKDIENPVIHVHQKNPTDRLAGTIL